MTDPAIDRRALLATGVAIGTGVAAGCLGDDASNDAGQPTDGGDSGDGSTDHTNDSGDGTDDSGDAEVAFETEPVVEGLEHPWGMAVLPDDAGLLVTERPGRLQWVDRDDNGDGEGATEIGGTPEVFSGGQGGLLDVVLHPEYPGEPWVYLTYAVENDAGETSTAVGRGRFDATAESFDGEDLALAGFEELFVAEPFQDSNGHFGSRAVFGDDGALYVTVGDRQRKDFGPDHVSQDTTNHLGSTLRLAPDGSIPEDNPFVDDSSVRDAIYSYGHRNAQGMTVRPATGAIWQSEHGEEEGDELNAVQRGGNHGWPIATYGCHYGTEDPVGDPPAEHPETVPPVYYWECPDVPGISPGGATFYDGDAFPEWQGDLFVASLVEQYLAHFSVAGPPEGEGDPETPDPESIDVTELDSLLADRGWRIRDVTVAPDTGFLYVAVDAPDAPIVRLVPA